MVEVTTRYLSIAEYAALVGVSHKTIRGMVARGELVAHRFGRVLRIDPDEAHEATRYRPRDRRDTTISLASPRPPSAGSSAAERRRDVDRQFERAYGRRTTSGAAPCDRPTPWHQEE